MTKTSQKLFYDPTEIRTGNMLPLRDSDIDFGDEPSRTKQSEAAACDINNIMAPYARMDMRDLLQQNPGLYLDLGPSETYHEAMNRVVQAQEAFERLPAEIRKFFGNDPENFLAFAEDKENLPAMVEMGLAEPSKLPATPVPDAKEEAAPAAPSASKKPKKSDTE